MCGDVSLASDASEAGEPYVAGLSFIKVPLYELGALGLAGGAGALASGAISALVGSILLSSVDYSAPGEAALKSAVEGLSIAGIPVAVLGGAALVAGGLLCAAGIVGEGATFCAAPEERTAATPVRASSSREEVRRGGPGLAVRY